MNSIKTHVYIICNQPGAKSILHIHWECIYAVFAWAKYRWSDIFQRKFFFQIWIRGYFDSGTFIWHPLFTEQFHSLIIRNFCTCTTQKCTIQAATKYECNTVPKLVFFFFILMMMMIMMMMMIIIIIIISWSWSSWSWSWESSSIWQLEHHWNC